jgi:hypothetical protein
MVCGTMSGVIAAVTAMRVPVCLVPGVEKANFRSFAYLFCGN